MSFWNNGCHIFSLKLPLLEHPQPLNVNHSTCSHCQEILSSQLYCSLMVFHPLLLVLLSGALKFFGFYLFIQSITSNVE